MDPPVTDSGPDQKHEISKEGVPAFHCNLCDLEVLHKLAQILLPGLATACVDNTSGDLFKGPGSVVVDIRKEMVEYITQRSETFVAESLIEDGTPYVPTSDDPIDIIADFIDDFANTKQNLFSRVSGWLLSEKREDKIDDFVQEMELSSFWVMERRLSIAETLLKNVDLEGKFHCTKNFDTAEDRDNHINLCTYRSMDCTNEGCRASFCAMHMENHDSVCPYKILPCEQKCSESITRREMDRHCITVCPMKLVNCPFYHVGCQSSIPYCTAEQHCAEFLQSHLLYILRLVHKEAHVEDLKYRVEQLQQSSFADQFSEAKDVRSLTRLVKHLDAKLGPLEYHRPSTGSDKQTDSADVSEHVADEAAGKVDSSEEPSKPEPSQEPSVTSEIPKAKNEVESSQKQSEVESSQEPSVTSEIPKAKNEVDSSQKQSEVECSQEPSVTSEIPKAKNEVESSQKQSEVESSQEPSATSEIPEAESKVESSQEPTATSENAEAESKVDSSQVPSKVESSQEPSVTSENPEATSKVESSQEPSVTSENPEAEPKIYN